MRSLLLFITFLLSLSQVSLAYDGRSHYDCHYKQVDQDLHKTCLDSQGNMDYKKVSVGYYKRIEQSMTEIWFVILMAMVYAIWYSVRDGGN